MAVVVRRARAALAVVACVAVTLTLPAAEPVAAGQLLAERILFTRGTPDGSGADILVVATDGSAEQVIVRDGYSPDLSPDGTRVLFSRSSDDGPWTVALDGSDPHHIADMPHTWNFRWSPDGQRIVYTGTVEYGAPALFVMNADGTGQTRLKPYVTDGDYDPQWTPDGLSVMYGSLDNLPSIRIIGVDGAGDRNIDDHHATFQAMPSVSSAGDAVAFVGLPNTYPPTDTSLVAIYTMSVAGTSLTQLTPLVRRWLSEPTFAPDATRVVYGDVAAGGSDVDKTAGLWIANRDGSGPRQLTAGHHDIPSDWRSDVQFGDVNMFPHAGSRVSVHADTTLFGNADLSYDEDGVVVRYEWRWGDNTAMTPHKYAWHKYAHAGTYLVRLTVTDDDGAKTTKKAWIKVA